MVDDPARAVPAGLPCSCRRTPSLAEDVCDRVGIIPRGLWPRHRHRTQAAVRQRGRPGTCSSISPPYRAVGRRRKRLTPIGRIAGVPPAAVGGVLTPTGRIAGVPPAPPARGGRWPGLVGLTASPRERARPDDGWHHHALQPVLPLSTAVVVTGAGAVPVRLPTAAWAAPEIRPTPGIVYHGLFATEGTHARAGISARWIAAVDRRAPLPRRSSRPTPAAANEALFQEWVRPCTRTSCQVSAPAHLPAGVAAHRGRAVLIMEPRYTKGSPPASTLGLARPDPLRNEAIERFGSTVWLMARLRPRLGSPAAAFCACDACRALFHQETGSSTCRRAWTGPTPPSGAGGMALRCLRALHRPPGQAIRQRHPHAAIVVNHYHRPTIPRHSAIPRTLRGRYHHRPEATGPARVDLTMRLCRAYGRKQSRCGAPSPTAQTLLPPTT